MYHFHSQKFHIIRIYCSPEGVIFYTALFKMRVYLFISKSFSLVDCTCIFGDVKAGTICFWRDRGERATSLHTHPCAQAGWRHPCPRQLLSPVSWTRKILQVTPKLPPSGWVFCALCQLLVCTRVSKVAQGLGDTSRAGFVPRGFLAVLCGCCANSESPHAAKPMASRRPHPPEQQEVGLQ